MDNNFTEIGEISQQNDLILGANKNLRRAIPDAHDGLKPVHRRILYTIYRNPEYHKLTKVATIGTSTLTIHPHGDLGLPDVIVGLAQPWNVNVQIIQPGEGNFGTPAGDTHAAARYISATMSKYAMMCYFHDFKSGVAKMEASYDGNIMIPGELPARYPTVLFNGSMGIGFGASSNIPPFNVKEVVNVCIKLMADPNAKFRLIPDSPTGADVIMEKGVLGGFKDKTIFDQICNFAGNGYYRQRAKYSIDNADNTITILSLPLQSDLKTITQDISKVKKQENVLQELVDMKDFSGRGASVKLVLYLSPKANPYKFLRKLFTKVPGLEKSYRVNIDTVENYKIRHDSIRTYILGWLDNRRSQVEQILKNELSSTMSDIAINSVKLFILDKNHLEQTVAIFKSSRNKKDLIAKLLDRYAIDAKMTSQQAEVISAMTAVDYGQEAYEGYEKRAGELHSRKQELQGILRDPNGVDDYIKAELKECAKLFGGPRRSNVVNREISVDNTTHDDYTIILTKDKENIMKVTKSESSDVIKKLIEALPDTHVETATSDSDILFVDNQGMYETVKISDIPLSKTESDLFPISRYTRSDLGKISMIKSLDNDDTSLLFITANGVVKRTLPSSFVKKSSTPCIGLTDGDHIVRILTIPQDDDIPDVIIYTEQGYGQRISVKDIVSTGASSKGRVGVRLTTGDHIAGAFVVDTSKDFLLYVTRNGYVRLNRLKHFPQRGGKDDLSPIAEIGVRDSLISILTVNSNDVVSLCSADSEIKINVSDIPVSMMSNPLKKIKDTRTLLSARTNT